MTELVVLPGLDGTATMHADFVSAVGSAFGSVAVVAYPPDEPMGYAELERLVRASLPAAAPFVLLGESFSGPIAMAIAANPPPNLVGLVLSTTFARSPIPMLRAVSSLTRFAPVRSLPSALLSWFLLGRWGERRLKEALDGALLAVTPGVLRHRAGAALRADVTSQLRHISVPLLYLHATEDRLLSPGASKPILSAVPHAVVVDIVGPHLLLQTAPKACARAVSDFVLGLSPGGTNERLAV